jgi:DNA-binding beta-propeller fold protein YncE
MHARTLIAALIFTFLLCTGASAISLVKQETLASGAGVKAVLISPDAGRVYSANLESMRVYEYDRAVRKILRRLEFEPTPGKGYNYSTREYFDSYEEKPVELHITHGGRILWVSLHNAGGVVAWDISGGETFVEGRGFKNATITSYPDRSEQEARLLFIPTGATPKIITSSPDGKFLFVANWHSDSVSVLDIGSDDPEQWKKLRDIKGRIPRGLLVTPDSSTLYVAEMGAEHIMEIGLPTFEKKRTMHVGLNPRHMALADGELYISLNLSNRVAALDLGTGEVRTSAACPRPRTIALARDEGVLLSVCYRGDKLQAFGYPGIELLGEWDSPPHPVGLDIYTPGDGTIEAWVANYTNGVVSVYIFTAGPETEVVQEAEPVSLPEALPGAGVN